MWIKNIPGRLYGKPLEAEEQIPSEIIEPYIKRFMMQRLESLFFGLTTPAKIKQELQALSFFVSCSCGIHAKLATSNEFYKIESMTDQEMSNLVKNIFKDY